MLLDSVYFDIFGKISEDTVINLQNAIPYYDLLDNDIETKYNNGIFSMTSQSVVSKRLFDGYADMCSNVLKRMHSPEVLIYHYNSHDFGMEYGMISRDGLEDVNISELLFQKAQEKMTMLKGEH